MNTKQNAAYLGHIYKLGMTIFHLYKRVQNKHFLFCFWILAVYTASYPINLFQTTLVLTHYSLCR